MTKIKDPVSGFTHLGGAVLSVIGLVFLIIFSAKYGKSNFTLVSSILFGTSLILLYTASSVYHLVKGSDKVTIILRKLDHIMIYILIAGSYTPMCLGPLRGGWGWSIFGVVWGLAIFGLFLTLFWLSAPRFLSTAIYIGMGWIVIIAAYPLIKVFSENGILYSLLWLLAGGIFYTIGGVIYGLKWPKVKNKYFGFHEIFHIFVMLGSICQYWFILKYVVLV